MSILDRKENESDFSYKYRLIMGKKNKSEPYSSLEWEDIREKLNLDQHRDTLRKRGDAWEELISHADEVGLKNSDNETLLEIKKERVKLSDLRTEVNRQIRQLSKLENVVDLIKENISDLSEENPLITNELHINNSNVEGILCLSDLHIGATTDNSINEYNIDIAKERLNKVIDNAIKYGLNHNISKLNIILNGDLISGELHSTIKLSNQETLAKQITIASEIISQAICKLSKHFYCTVQQNNGNHEAVDILKDTRSNKSNYSMLINEMIKLRCNDLSNVVFLDSINNGEMSVCYIRGQKVVSCHGDQVKKDKCAEQLALVTNGRPDVVILGHYHRYEVQSQLNTEVFVNGSLVSTDDYAFKLKLYNKPSQLMLIIGDEGVECSYNIKAE